MDLKLIQLIFLKKIYMGFELFGASIPKNQEDIKLDQKSYLISFMKSNHH